MDFAIKKSEIELKTIKAKYENIKAMHSTISTAMRIVKGNPDDNYMFELALQKTNEEMTQKLGEIKNAAESAKDFIGNFNMEKGVMLEKGQQILDNGANLSILKDYEDSKGQSVLSAGPSLNAGGLQSQQVISTSLLD